MAKIKTGLGIGVIFAIVLITLSLAFIFPANFNSIDSVSNESFIQNENESIFVTTNLESKIIDVNDSTDNITVRLTNTETNEKISLTDLKKNTNESITLSSSTITVFYEDKSNKDFLLSYEYDTYFNWPTGAKTIMQNMDIMLITIAIVTLFGLGLLTWGITKND